MPSFIYPVLLFVSAVLIILVGMLLLVLKFFKKVEQGKALIVNTMRSEPVVTFTGKVVYPVINKAEIMDISLKTIEIDRRGREGLICRDNIRADIKVAFFVRVNKTREDVLKVAQSIGCARASDQETMEELFSAKFSEALKTVGKQMDFEDLYKKRDQFRDSIIEVIGHDLNGYVLEDAAIDYLEQTPLQSLDAQNILDAQGIYKITQLTALQHVETNRERRDEEMRIRQKDVEAREAILALNRQQSEAEAKQEREIATVQSREQAEAARVAAEERLKMEQAGLQTDEHLAVQEENKQREIDVAAQNRKRAVAIEVERVERARALEAVARERDVEMETIAKEKALEQERKAIADVIRERIAVERTVAEEEERIKELRAVASAERDSRTTVITAEAEAQKLLVADIKAAEAGEQAARFKARERLTLAEAQQEASDKEAQAKIRLAEGVQAEAAATGLAEARVREANAVALEKQGLAEARIQLEKLRAEAAGTEEQGMAEARVQEAAAEALQKKGLAEARVEQEKMQAVAAGTEEQGMAQVRVDDAAAAVVEKRGLAEARAIQERLYAEAHGLSEKFNAIKSMGPEGQAYEELRLKLDILQAVEMAAIGANKEIAEAQAGVLGKAFSNAKIDIVGGEGVFFDRLVNAISMTKSVDRFVGSGQTAGELYRRYQQAGGNLLGDLKEVLSRPAVSTEDLQRLSVTAFLGRLLGGGDLAPEHRAKLEQLLKLATELGLDQTGPAEAPKAED